MKIYRIIIKNFDYSYMDILEKIMFVGDYCYSDKSFFVNSDKPYNVVFDKVKDFGDVNEITNQKDISLCSDLVKNWYFNIITKDAIKKFENSDDGQKKMAKIMNYLDKIERNNRKGVNNGTRKQSRPRKTK